MRQDNSVRGLRSIATLEGAKGLLVLLVGFELLVHIHKNLHIVAVELVKNLHLNPAGHYPRIFLDLADRITNGELWLLAGGALLYALLRMSEAYGLWRQQHWAQWFGVISSGIYLPVELYEAIAAFSWGKGIILAVNLAVVGFLSWTLHRDRLKKQ